MWRDGLRIPAGSNAVPVWQYDDDEFFGRLDLLRPGLEDAAWQCRSAVIAVFSKALPANLELIDLVAARLEDSHGRVRFAALECLGQCSRAQLAAVGSRLEAMQKDLDKQKKLYESWVAESSKGEN